MKTIVEINQKIGQPNYGSFGAGCRFEMDIDQQLLGSDPQQILAHCKLLGDLARAAVERELDLQRKHGQAPSPAPAAAPAREPGDDGDDDDPGLRPGDPAYERSRPRRGNRPPDSRTEEQRRESFEERQRGYNNYIEETAPRDDRPARYDDGGRRDDRQSDRRSGGRDSGPPQNARQFLGWLNKQSEDVKNRAKRTGKAWGLPSMFREWSDDEAADMYHELTSKRESDSHRNGSGSNGYAGSRNGSNGNGRGGY